MLFERGEHLCRIRGALHKGSESIREVGIACYEADVALDSYQVRLLIKDLGFSRATFSKYVAIGRDKRLHDDPKISHLFPAKFSVIYELTQLDDDRFNELVSTGGLTQSLKREQLIRWRKGSAGAPAKACAATASKVPIEYQVATELLSNEWEMHPDNRGDQP
jgi:hypothetical protein